MARLPRLTERVPTPWRNRIVDHGTTTAEEIARHPRNPKVHGAEQRGAITAILDDVGWVAPLVINRTTGLLLDGHMRVEEAASRGPIPVVYVELTEAEENEVLALMDPIGAMAGHDADALSKLIEGMESSVDLDVALAGLLPVDDPDPRQKPVKVELKPLQRAHVLIAVPLDRWDEIADVLDSLSEIPGLTIASTVN